MRFGYVTNAEPNSLTCVDCSKIDMRDGVIVVHTVVLSQEKKESFQLSELKSFFASSKSKAPS